MIVTDKTLRVSFSLRGLAFLSIVSAATLAFAAEAAAADSIDEFQLAMKLFGGLALFLFGIDQMSDGLKAVAGNRMATLLGGMTRNRFLGGITGAFVTAILNSSSVTTVLVVGFTTAGIMTLQQSIGVIMGANIGSTMTAQIVAFNVTQYAMLPIAIGFGMIFFGKNESTKHSGAMLFGLGLLFGGMGIMSEAMYPLRSFPPFLDLMARMENPLLGILVGAGFTALVQSSAATTGIAIVMAAEGLMSLPAGIALALGANIGTCATALLAAIGKPVAARRAAGAHVLFNVLGVLVWLPIIGLLAELATAASPAHPELVGAARMAEEVPRQIANAHTIFNVTNTMIFIWFTGFFARAVEKLVPDRVVVTKEIIVPKFLDDALLATPMLAMRAARFEGHRMGEIALEMVNEVGPAIKSRDVALFDEIEKKDDQIDVLKEKIMEYLGEIYKQQLTSDESQLLLRLMRGVDEVQRIGTVVRNDLIGVGRQLIESDIETSETTQHALTALYDQVRSAVTLAVDAIAELDESKALEVVQMKSTVNGLIDGALDYQQERIAPTEPQLIALFRLEDEVIDALKRIYSLSKRLANLLLPHAVAARDV
ncbi:MAG: Na/Pi cotransporter family protein [Gammaproteobacteria bacterium]|nr:Na/Pi cotransporter family protein [Gammaproteobacteria bacterium]